MRNKPAVIGLVFIVLSVIVAVLGYQITPDFTPDANDQVLQIANKPPGFSIQMLKRAKNKSIESSNFFSTMFEGKENPYEMIPINSYRFEGAEIVYEEYTGGNAGVTKKASLADVAYPLSTNQTVTSEGNDLTFYDYDARKITTDIATLQNKIEAENIVTKTYHFGTDDYGRDILSRLIIGIRVSLSIGFVAVIISLVIGVLIGAVSGYFGGWIDELCMWFINVTWAIPTLLLVIAIQLALGRGFWQVYVAVGLTIWVEVARIVRGQMLGLRQMLYVEATKSLGYGHVRTIGIHILPNMLGPLMVVTAANFASAILLEAGLSFLGIGVQPPMASWGSMLSKDYAYIMSGNAFRAIAPGVAIMLMVYAFNLVGNGLRDALDVRTSLGND